MRKNQDRMTPLMLAVRVFANAKKDYPAEAASSKRR